MSTTIRILESFRGDPENTGHATVAFKASEERGDLSDDYAALIVKKGLAEIIGDKAPAPEPAASKTQPIPSAPKV